MKIETNEDKEEKHDGQNNDKEKPVSKSTKEDLYDKIPITKKQLDILIAILFAALIILLVFGTLVGNRIL